MERAVVAVRWAGTRFYRGRFQKSWGESRRESWLVLGRRAGTRSDLARSLATARCTACGGPDAGESAACVWCGERLNDGSRDWVLLEVLTPNTPAARALEAELSQDRTEAATRGEGAVSAGGLLAWAVALSASDGRIAPRERRALHRLAEIVGVERTRLARWIQAALRGEFECEQPGAGEAPAWCAALQQIASADGELHRRERQLLARLAARASG